MADIDSAGREAKLSRTAKSRRSSNRDSLFLSATIRRAGDQERKAIAARARNLSAVGVMVDYVEQAVPGEAVVVTVRGIGSVPGKIAWVRQGRVGIAFDVEVDPKLARKPIKLPPRTPVPPKRPMF